MKRHFVAKPHVWGLALLFSMLLVLIPRAIDSEGGYDVYTYITDYWKHSIVVFKNLQQVDTLVTSGTATNSIGITPDGNRIYVANNLGDSISVFVVEPGSSNSRKEIALIKTDGSPVSLRVNPDGNKVYAIGGRRVWVIDSDPSSPSYHTIIKKVTLPGYSFDLDFSPDSDRLFVANYSPNDEAFISVIETGEDELIDSDADAANGITSIPIGGHTDRRAWFKCLRVGSLGYGYVLNHGSSGGGASKGDYISVFDTATMQPYDVDNDPDTTTPGLPEGISGISLPGILPVALCFNSDGTRLYVALRDALVDTPSIKGKILMIDTDPGSPKFNTIIRIAEAGLRPEGVGIWPDNRYVLVSCRWSHFVRVFDKNLLPITSMPVNYGGEMVSIIRNSKSKASNPG